MLRTPFILGHISGALQPTCVAWHVTNLSVLGFEHSGSESPGLNQPDPERACAALFLADVHPQTPHPVLGLLFLGHSLERGLWLILKIPTVTIQNAFTIRVAKRFRFADNGLMPSRRLCEREV